MGQSNWKQETGEPRLDLLSPTTLEQVISIARGAGARLQQMVDAHPHVWEKAPGDLLTDADIAVNDYVTTQLRTRFPQTSIWSEEGTAPSIQTSQPVWLVDPLDGTTNFAHRFPTFAVSIALWVGHTPLLGVVYDPMRDHTFAALRGHGATLNGHLLKVSTTQEARHALMACDWARGRARERLLILLNRVGREAHAVRAIGAAALGISYVAAGWLDGYFNASLYPWDYGAAAVILIEAGGRISTWDGIPLALEKTHLICGNPVIHHRLQAWAAALFASERDNGHR